MTANWYLAIVIRNLVSDKLFVQIIGAFLGNAEALMWARNCENEISIRSLQMRIEKSFTFKVDLSLSQVTPSVILEKIERL